VRNTQKQEPSAKGYSSLNTTMKIQSGQGATDLLTVVRTKVKKGHETRTTLIDSDRNEYVLVKSKESTPMIDSQLMGDIVIVLLASSCFGLCSRLLGMPVLLGYIIAGVAIGPAHLAFIQSFIQVETFSQFGVTFLLFVLGMEFSIAKLLASLRVALTGGALGIFVTIALTWMVMSWMGTGTHEALFTGAFLSMSSTAVVLKCIEDSKASDSPAAQVMVSVLIVQDIALGVMLGVMPVLEAPPAEIVWAVMKLFAMVVSILVVAGFVTRSILPHYFGLLLRTNSAELWVLGVVSVCLIASSATEHLGLSIETGAFLAGIMISNGKHAHRVVQTVEPLRDIFAAMFFTSIGVHVDAFYIWENLQLILMICLVVTIMKVLVLTTMVKLSGFSIVISLHVGIALAQIGEFAFVLAAHGKSLGLVSLQLHKLLLHTTVVSLVLTPFLIRATPWLVRPASVRCVETALAASEKDTV